MPPGPPGPFQVTAYRCRCGHEWVPANLHQPDPPRVCPKCKSYNWDKPRQFSQAERQARKLRETASVAELRG